MTRMTRIHGDAVTRRVGGGRSGGCGGGLGVRDAGAWLKLELVALGAVQHGAGHGMCSTCGGACAARAVGCSGTPPGDEQRLVIT